MTSFVMPSHDRPAAWLRAAVVCGVFLVIPVAASEQELQPLSREAFHSTDPRLGELIGLLLEENPELLAARAQWRSDIARIPQARALPDPMVSYRYFAETPETRVGPQEHGLEFSQNLPWAGKRQQQEQRATHAASGLAWSIRDLERSLVAELKRSYFEVAYLQQALAINAEEADLLRRYEQIVLTRYSTGEGAQQSVIKVQTDLGRLVDQETALRTRLESATRHIMHLLGRSERELPLDLIVLELEPLEFDSEALLDESMREHPRIQAIEQAIQSDRAWLRRRQLDRRPDFRVGLGYVGVGSRDDAAGRADPPEGNGQDIWSLTLGVNLPVYRKRIQAGVTEVQESIRSRERRRESRRDQIQFDVREAALRLESAGERARLYRDVIVPQARESLASAEAAYTTGRQGFLDLLDAQRVLLQVRLTYHRLVADYWVAAGDLEHGLGARFPGEGSER